MTIGAATVFSWAGSSAFLNKERPQSEKGVWVNKTTDIYSLLNWVGQGYAATCPLGLNITNSDAYEGEPDSSLGPYMRETRKKSERLNANALPSGLLSFDLDGDTTIEKLLATNFAKTKLMAISTSSRHLRVEIDGVKQHRLRLFCVLERAEVPLFFDNDLYRDPFWFLKVVRSELLTELCQELGIAKLVDECGKDPARIWYGNTGPEHPIGDKYPDIPAGPLEQIVLGNTIPDAYIRELWEQSEPRNRKQQSLIDCIPATDIDDVTVGTPRQLQTAAYILSNNILSDERAADYTEWIRLLHAVKKLDPGGGTLLDPFLKFSQQSSDHDACMDDILERLEQLPAAEDIYIGITAIKSAATEDTPGWEAGSPSIGSRTVSPASRGFIASSVDGPMLVHLRKMYKQAGVEAPDFISGLAEVPISPLATQPLVRSSTQRRQSPIRSLLQKHSRGSKNQSFASSPKRSQDSDEYCGYFEPDKRLPLTDKYSDF